TYTERAIDWRGYYFFNQNNYLRMIVRDWKIDRELARYRDHGYKADAQNTDWQLMYSWRPTLISTLYAGVASGKNIENAHTSPWESKEISWFMKWSIGFDGSGRFF
ncbi:MAG: hypothetical protein K2Q15_04870, partial [Burkholderiales bacterium]|nr:hypothetical protein [Burkholderiales bacterium]